MSLEYCVRMIVYKYVKTRTSSNLFSERRVIDDSYMAEDQVIIYYPIKLIDISNSMIIFILENQFRTKVFRDRFMDELIYYISTMNVDNLKIIKSVTKDKTNFNNNSSVRFISNYRNRGMLRGFSATSIITDEGINTENVLSNLRIN